MMSVGGSRFHLCDLQVHTPADKQHQYGDAGGREPNRAFADKLMEAHASAGVTVVAVTDHNRVDWYPVLREAGEAVGVFVFPGLEFSVSRCHVLTIWDRTEEGFEFAQRFLESLWKPGTSPFQDNGDPRVVSTGQVGEWVERATKDYRALALAPHATMKNIGFFAKGVCSNRDDVIETGLLSGYDVWGNQKADVLANPASEFGEQQPSWFISGDTRSFDDVGKRAVYLKMGAEPTLEGLRQAFLVPDTRIRFPVDLKPSFGHVVGVRFIENPMPTWSRIDALEIRGGFHDGLKFSLGPGLNALIGGKGTGKSTLVEIVRHVLHAGVPHEREAADNRRHNFKANAEALLGYHSSSGDFYEVVRTGSEDPGRLLRDGTDLGIEVSRRAGARVFGQRELQSLAEKPDSLRDFVATEAGSPWVEALADEQARLQSLRQLNAAIDEIEESINSLDDAEQELADLTERIERADTGGAADLVEASSVVTGAASGMEAALDWPQAVGKALDDLDALLPPPEVPLTPSNGEAVATALGELGDAVAASLDQLRKSLRLAEEACTAEAVKWSTEYEELRKDIERRLAEAGLDDPREFSRLQARAGDLNRRLSDLPDLRGQRTTRLEERAKTLRALAEARRRKSRLIEDAGRSLNARLGSRVRIRTEALEDKSELTERLEAAVRGQSVKSEQLRSLANSHSPAAIAGAMSSGISAVQDLGCTAATAAKLCAVPASAVRKIEEADTPDMVYVEVNLASGDSESWQDAVRVSPGQRSMALLALVLTAGSEPLIIDQPEDDLDNRYIYDEVVKVLAEVCQNRQVIVATHNANIPVLGDADLVVALDANESRSEVLAVGGLEDPRVAECARRILEGGEEAFRARQRRYESSAV